MQGALQGLSAALGVFFLAGALSKLDAWSTWKRTLARFIPLPETAGALLRIAVPTGEITVSLLLFTRIGLGLVAASGLLTLFGMAVAILTRRHAGEDCGCFGQAAHTEIGWRLAGRNLLLAFVAASAAFTALRTPVPPLSALQITAAILLGLLVLAVIEGMHLRQISVPRQRRT